VVKLSANRSRNRGRKKERKQAGAELQDARPGKKTAEQEVAGLVEVDNDKEKKSGSEVKISTPEIGGPSEQTEPQLVDHARSEPGTPSKASVARSTAEQKSGGKRVADNREGIFEGFTKINESVFSFEGVKKAAAWYIETSEKLAHQALELQEKATGWAKDTPFAPLFEAQNSFARKFVERSANAARTLWQIHPGQ
jgi:hypothetical protein